MRIKVRAKGGGGGDGLKFWVVEGAGMYLGSRL